MDVLPVMLRQAPFLFRTVRLVAFLEALSVVKLRNGAQIRALWERHVPRGAALHSKQFDAESFVAGGLGGTDQGLSPCMIIPPSSTFEEI